MIIFIRAVCLVKKKLSKYFKDEKLSTIEKENTLIIYDENALFGSLVDAQTNDLLPRKQALKF